MVDAQRPMKQNQTFLTSAFRTSKGIKMGLLALLLMLGTLARANIVANVDRTEIVENESLQLTITSKLEMSSSFDLFNLNNLSIPQPDLTELEKDFEILDRRQSYRVQIENNQNNSVITWDYTLMPKRSGELTIPPIEYDGHTSQPITIQVRNAATNIPNQQKDVFLEAEVDLNEVYVQQQLIYKVRLFYSQDLVRGELQHPDHPDVFFKQLGKQREFSRHIGTRRFSVIEREYAVFPQKAGEFEIPSLLFTGTLIERRIGRRIFGKEQSPAIKIKVNPPPASFTGKHWLPAQSLNIRDQWSDPSREMKTGDSVTQTISVQALGLEGVQLPPLQNQDFAGLKMYPEPAGINTEEHAAGLTGQREETRAIIALRPGVYTLPEIRIPWWDVVNDVERVAILPSRVMTVTGAAMNTQPNWTPADDQPAPQPGTDAPSPATLQPAAMSQPQDSSAWVWQATTALFLLLWLITAWAWWRKSPTVSPESSSARPGTQPTVDLQRLEQLAASGDPKFTPAVLQWAESAKRSRLLTGAQVTELMHECRPLLNEIDRLHYGNGSSGADMSNLAHQVIAVIKSHLAKRNADQQETLAPLYPVS